MNYNFFQNRKCFECFTVHNHSFIIIDRSLKINSILDDAISLMMQLHKLKYMYFKETEKKFFLDFF